MYDIESKPFAVRLTRKVIDKHKQVVILVDHIVALIPYIVTKNGEPFKTTLVLTSPGITYEVEEDIDTILLLIAKGDMRR